ncbi:MAG TPA: type II secretion system protein [Candidatus Baltobacteraceae bacterium]|jgi:type II secretory pathway pseudopilin PulG|nr:type II secretion system protein [Candidatus Baltobacteraceae bacterium]
MHIAPSEISRSSRVLRARSANAGFNRDGEAGFTIVETMVSVAILAMVISGAMGLAIQANHEFARLAMQGRGEQAAQNMISDLRSMSAYGSDELNALIGHNGSGDVAQPIPEGTPMHLRVHWSVLGESTAHAIAVVSVDLPNGESVSEQADLASEAPAPGSSVGFLPPPMTPPPPATPFPCSTAQPAPTGISGAENQWAGGGASSPTPLPSLPPGHAWCPTPSSGGGP